MYIIFVAVGVFVASVLGQVLSASEKEAFGLVVLFPPTRSLIRNVLKRRFRITTIRRYNGRPYDDGSGGPPSGPPVIDV